MSKLNRQLLEHWQMAPPGFSPERALDLTRILDAREFHYRHPDGRLHVLRFRNRGNKKMLDITVPPKPALPPSCTAEELFERLEERRKKRESPAEAVRRHFTAMDAVIPDEPLVLEAQDEERDMACHGGTGDAP